MEKDKEMSTAEMIENLKNAASKINKSIVSDEVASRIDAIESIEPKFLDNDIEISRMKFEAQYKCERESSGRMRDIIASRWGLVNSSMLCQLDALIYDSNNDKNGQEASIKKQFDNATFRQLARDGFDLAREGIFDLPTDTDKNKDAIFKIIDGLEIVLRVAYIGCNFGENPEDE